MIAVGSIHRESGEVIVGTGYPLAIPAVAMRHSMGPNETRSLDLHLERMTDEDIRHLGPDHYTLVIGFCTIPLPVELPGPLAITLLPLAE